MRQGKQAVPNWAWLAALVPLLLAGAGMLPAFAKYGLQKLAAAGRPAAAAPSASASAPAGPRLDGAAVDLSTVMGRARALANEWQAEAALLGVEATLRLGKIDTGAGASAKLTFGPSAFGPAPTHSGLFVVTYDKTGIRGSGVAGRPSKTLPEPMCAPEHVVGQLGEDRHQSLLLRYAFDNDDRALWLVSLLSAPERVRAFDSQDCRVRGVVVPPVRR